MALKRIVDFRDDGIAQTLRSLPLIIIRCAEQGVTWVMAVINRPPYLIADEPGLALD